MNTETATSQTTSHKLICDGPMLGHGVRQERPWHCTCGATFFGYDSPVKKDFRAHKLEA